MYASTLPRSNWLRQRASIRLAWYRHMPASSYCKNVLEQGLLSAIRCIGLYLEQRLCGPAGHSACTPFRPHCRLYRPTCVPMCLSSLNYRKLAAEQSESKPRGLFSVVSAATDGVSSQNFRHMVSCSKFWSTHWLSEARTLWTQRLISYRRC